jgi:hypothetical protein
MIRCCGMTNSKSYLHPHFEKKNKIGLSYHIFRPIARTLSIKKRSEIVKNEHARYMLESTVLCIVHNFQLKLVCSIH